MNYIKDFIDKYLKPREFSFFSSTIGLTIFFGIIFLLFTLYNIGALKDETKSLKERVAFLEAGLATTTLTSTQLAERLAETQTRNTILQENLSDISGTVGTLERLSKTDKELLQKYSRVYFLSDNFVPMSMTAIDEKYLYDPTKVLEFHTSAMPFLIRMMVRASKDNIVLNIVSAYRSFGTQSLLKSSYLVTYGTGANQFSADQGYSEHQLGTALDLTTDGLSSPLEVSFEKTKAYEWLQNNAYKYGFILSYPKNNAYYQFEPWHWRFVGVELATRLHNEGITFADLDQREIDTYLVNIFQ